MEKKNYTAKYFRESIPEWKFKKDPLIAQWFYRPLSFYISAFCANRGISANAVSYFSMLFAIGACVCYFVDNHIVHICGAIIVNLWLIQMVQLFQVRSFKSRQQSTFYFSLILNTDCKNNNFIVYL